MSNTMTNYHGIDFHIIHSEMGHYIGSESFLLDLSVKLAGKNSNVVCVINDYFIPDAYEQVRKKIVHTDGVAKIVPSADISIFNRDMYTADTIANAIRESVLNQKILYLLLEDYNNIDRTLQFFVEERSKNSSVPIIVIGVIRDCLNERLRAVTSEVDLLFKEVQMRHSIDFRHKIFAASRGCCGAGLCVYFADNTRAYDVNIVEASTLIQNMKDAVPRIEALRCDVEAEEFAPEENTIPHILMYMRPIAAE